MVLIPLVEKVKLEIQDFFNLQISEKKKFWQTSQHIEGFGQAFVITTNGIYQSIEHRAVVNSEKERLSIATFYSPKQEGIVGHIESLITQQTPSRFRKIGVEEHFVNLFARKLDGKSYIDVMRIEHED
ncbi:hypothetical protein RYX36_009827 [Vicia faba]